MSLDLETSAVGAGWLLARWNKDGSLLEAKDLSAYYKAPVALLWSGYADEARAVLEFVKNRFLRDGGDLDGTGVAWIEQYRIYPHAWLAWGAHELGDFQLAQELTGFLKGRWNLESGGFRTREDGTEEIMTTSMAGLACLVNGESAVAAGTARWLEMIFRTQPDLQKELVHVWRPGEGLVRGDGSAAFVVDCSKLRQWYFQYGISAAFLAEYAKRTGRHEALRLAEEYLRASAFCAEDRYRTPQSGKIGWGAAWVYAQTRDAEELRLVEQVSEGLRALQCGDGSWNAEGVYEAKPTASDAARFDVTAEFVALLAQMGRNTND